MHFNCLKLATEQGESLYNFADFSFRSSNKVMNTFESSLVDANTSTKLQDMDREEMKKRYLLRDPDLIEHDAMPKRLSHNVHASESRSPSSAGELKVSTFHWCCRGWHLTQHCRLSSINISPMLYILERLTLYLEISNMVKKEEWEGFWGIWVGWHGGNLKLPHGNKWHLPTSVRFLVQQNCTLAKISNIQ